MSEGKLKNCHVEEGRSPDVNISAYCHTEERSDVAISAYCHPSFSQENVKGSSNYKTIKSGRSLDLAFQLGAMTMISLFSFNAYATCTPTPDCASIGYTETSCETISLKCPFDQTKLYCFPCDSAYQYTCSNTNEYGNGNSCNNKYKSCCNTDCVVGNIYYSDGTCNSCLDANKTPIGIVVKDNELIMNLVYSSQFWSPTQANIPELPDYSDKLSAQTDFAGKSNTAKIVAYYGKNADASNNAGLYCYNYAPLGLENSKGNWYLPSAGEIYTYVSPNSDKITKVRNILDIEEPFHWFWSSTEYNYYNVWCVSATSGYMGGSTSKKESSVPVITSCFLSIN